ncbi:PolyADP-ribose polymerase [Senna tora]|uniref:PolyADP-ribose polymerase n=1 Tax=Senna tora TaxID=362788 RepID=A0A834T5L1_9FABA|nr:PolyADP-ribose polymerase [Senna tora]
MATIATFLTKFLSLFVLLVHLGCFIFSTAGEEARSHDSHHNPLSKPSSPSHPKFKTRKAISSSWTFIKHLFSTKSCKTMQSSTTATTVSAAALPTLTSARSSQQSLVSLAQPESHSLDPPPRKKPTGSGLESDIAADNNHFFPLRNDIFPCTACGEIFQKPNALEQHQSLKHAVSELLESDAGHNIVRIIFKSGWTNTQKSPRITRILKIHNSPKILAKFEEYRESVKSKAARNGAVKKRDERCIADGNELMRFHCSTFLCELGLNGNSGICGQQYCNICGIIKSGFSPKLDGISTLSTSWRAHVAIPEEVEEEFKFMNVKRAMLVCRVIAGRIGSDSDEAEKEDGGFDSVMARGGTGVYTRLDEEELLVFNPRAVLPCFVIVYSV